MVGHLERNHNVNSKNNLMENQLFIFLLLAAIGAIYVIFTLLKSGETTSNARWQKMQEMENEYPVNRKNK